MISSGDIVRVFHGNTAFVVEAALPDKHWRLISTRFNRAGRVVHETRVVGEGDIAEVVMPSPTYEPGTTVEHRGVRGTVGRDLGDRVEVIVDASRARLHVPGGNTLTVVPKSDLTLAAIRSLIPHDREERHHHTDRAHD